MGSWWFHTWALPGSMLSQLLSSVYECEHVEALSDITHKYIFDFILKLNSPNYCSWISLPNAPYVCVFQTIRWNINSVPFILKMHTYCSNPHILTCLSRILPRKIAKALLVLQFASLPSILQELVTRKQKILTNFSEFICQICFLTCPINCVPNFSFRRYSCWSFLLLSSNS